MSAEGIEDVLVSAENNSYPPSDIGRFNGRPEAVYVYLVVDGRPPDLEARVRREGSGSLLFGVFDRGAPRIRVVDRRTESLPATGNGVSGIVKFTVKTSTGAPLPAGNYTVEVYPASDENPPGEPGVVKSFIVQDGTQEAS